MLLVLLICTTPVTQTTVANRTPIANPQRVLTTIDEPVDITLSGSDADRNSIAFFISQRPLHGILTPLTYTGITSAKLIYTPNPGFSGADEFSFWAYDGSSYSKTPAKVSINVSR